MSYRKTDVSPLTVLRDKIIQLLFHFECKRVVTHVSGLYFGKNMKPGCPRSGKSQGKNIFSRSGNCQGILKFVRDIQNLSKVREKSGNFEITSLCMIKT